MTNATPATGNRNTRRRPGAGTWRDRGWKQLSYRIDPETHARVARQAERAGIANIDYIDRAVQEKLDRDEKKGQ
jgi:predicted HicB family RNase H-like nuclease